MRVVEDHTPAGMEQVFKSLVVLMLNCRFSHLKSVYIKSLKRIGDELGSDTVLRLCAEIDVRGARHV